MRRLPVHMTAEALQDLADIRTHYREVGGPAVSARVVGRIRKTLAHIGRMPKTGSPRPEMGEGVRLHVSGAYVIYVEVAAKRVDVLRILHAARDRDTIMGKKDSD